MENFKDKKQTTKNTTYDPGLKDEQDFRSTRSGKRAFQAREVIHTLKYRAVDGHSAFQWLRYRVRWELG